MKSFNVWISAKHYYQIFWLCIDRFGYSGGMHVVGSIYKDSGLSI